MLSTNAQPLLGVRIRHEPAAFPRRFKPSAAVLLIELMQHAGALRPRHAGFDPGERGLGARQDRGVVGERDAKRAGSRRDVAAVPGLPPAIVVSKPSS